jgi:hypothetical protein
VKRAVTAMSFRFTGRAVRAVLYAYNTLDDANSTIGRVRSGSGGSGQFDLGRVVRVRSGRVGSGPDGFQVG